MEDKKVTSIDLNDLPPHYLLNPARLTASKRQILVSNLDLMDIDRIVIERGRDYQSLRRDGDEWYLTCRNSRY